MGLQLSIFLISLSLLAHEILLMRLFSITSWSHFAYMVISLALLGFGASGSFLSFFREKITKRFNFFFTLFSFLYGISLFLCVWVIQLIPSTPSLIVWYKIQYFYLFLHYLILAIPFFLGAICIGMSFVYFKEEVPKLYFFNLLGSGAGTLSAVLFMYIFFPTNILLFLSIFGFLASIIYTISLRKRYLILTVSFLSLGICIFFYLNPPTLRVSEYKGLSKSLHLPKARILKEYFSPLGLIHVLESPAIRYAPGLSFDFEGEVPSQLAIFVDYDSMSVINNLQRKSSLNYLDYLTSSLPYHLLKEPEVLVIGAGGGTEVVNALYHKAKKIDAVEVNPQIIKIVNEDFANFAGKLYSLPQVNPVVAEGRGYAESTSKKYDLVQISLIDSFAASSAGIYATSESYLYTVEAIAKFLNTLTKDGYLCITRWIRNPPRDGIKILATVTEALEKIGIKDPSQHIIMIRSWSTSTLVAGKSPLSPSDIKEALRFTKKRAFDLCWYPGIKREEVNRSHILSEPYFYQAAKKIFSPQREKFYKDYLFNIAPATDDSPYFFHFFKWKSLPYLIKVLGKEWIPFIEWGYIILIATLSQAILASILIILIPLFFLSRKKLQGKNYPRLKVKIFLYFLLLGLSYMFLEISFIQRFTLFLHYPIYSAAVIITGFLTFSGLGSRFSSYFMSNKRYGVGLSVIAIACFATFYIVYLKKLFLPFIGTPDPLKIAISLSLIAPLAFFMGMPFPLGLSETGEKGPHLLPWAWGINGCASVVGSVFASLLAVSWGFTFVGILAIVLYVIVYLTYP